MMHVWFWIGFLVLIFFLLALDLGIFNRKSHVIGVKESFVWVTVWVSCALLFNVFVYFVYEYQFLGDNLVGLPEMNGKTAAMQFLTAYLVEQSLSLDNMFIFALIFTYFRIPLQYQHRVLYWGILGALIMRGIMIGAGTVLIRQFSWIIYVFGAFLIFTAMKLLFEKEDKLEPEKNLLFRLARKIFPVAPNLDGNRFFTRINGVQAATPLFFVLILLESTDVLFAVDSIPAVFSVTTDPFLVFTSNVFAILGLRSLYFVLAGVIDKFRFLRLCLVILLAYIGVKMLVSHHYPIPTHISLIIIAGIIVSGILASIFVPHKVKEAENELEMDMVEDLNLQGKKKRTKTLTVQR